jgi:hypothetical protein
MGRNTKNDCVGDEHCHITEQDPTGWNRYERAAFQREQEPSSTEAVNGIRTVEDRCKATAT